MNNYMELKKKSHYFEIYISKVLKQISEYSAITLNAKQQLNSFLLMILKCICTYIFNLISVTKKKTINIKEVENALKLILSGELLSNSIKEGNKSCQTFSQNNVKGNRQQKAKIIFPVSVIENFLRNNNSNIMISTLVPVYIASVLEYLTFEILDMSVILTNEYKHNRITVRDLELSVRNDIEFDLLFKKYNISFLGGGVVPYIHESLVKKKSTLAIQNIIKQQSKTSLIFSKLPFKKLVRHIFKSKLNYSIKICKNVFTVLQYFIEQYIIKLLYESNFLSIHAGRVKMIPIDIDLYESLCNNKVNPYTNNKNVELLILNSDENLI